MTWLTMTSIQLDGKGMAYNYTCVTDTGEVSSTAEVIGKHDLHWRRCVGATALGVAVALFLLLTVAMLTSWTVVRSWTHLCYLFKVRHLPAFESIFFISPLLLLLLLLTTE